MNNQIIENFRIASKRTMASLGNDKLDLSHCILGMVSELEEYVHSVNKGDLVNCGEELSDEFFYVVNYMTMRNIQIDYTFYSPKVKVGSYFLYIKLVNSISELSDLVKKYIAYNKEIDKEKEVLIVTNIINVLCLLYDVHELNGEKCLQNNINKLLVRFPLEEGFSDNRANNRDLKSERTELEK